MAWNGNAQEAVVPPQRHRVAAVVEVPLVRALERAEAAPRAEQQEPGGRAITRNRFSGTAARAIVSREPVSLIEARIAMISAPSRRARIRRRRRRRRNNPTRARATPMSARAPPMMAPRARRMGENGLYT